MVPVFKNARKRSTAKATDQLIFFSIVLFFFEKLVNSRFVDYLMKLGFCLISSKVLSLLGQLQIF